MSPFQVTFIEPSRRRRHIGKRISLRADGTLDKEQGELGSFDAWVESFESLYDFSQTLAELREYSGWAMLLGSPRGIQDGETFLVRPKPWLLKELGVSEESARTEVHEFRGKRVVGRFKEVWEPSRLALFDYDPDSRTPEDFLYKTPEEYLDALAKVHPDLAEIGFVVATSSSSDLQAVDGTSFEGGGISKYHAFFLLEDAQDLGRLKTSLEDWSHLNSMTWPKLTDATVPQVSDQYLFDASVFRPTQPIYAGMPQLCTKLSQERPAPYVRNGRALTVHACASPGDAQQKLLAEIHGESWLRRNQRSQSKTAGSAATSTGTTFQFDLDRSTQFVRPEDPHTVLSVKDFLKSDDEIWSVVSEFRVPIEEAHTRTNASEYLLRTKDGKSCTLYEHDGHVQHNFHSMEVISQFCLEHRIGGQRLWPDEDDPRRFPVSPEDVDLAPGTRTLLFGDPGQGKSHFASLLAELGYCVIFACSSNEQAEEQHGGRWSDRRHLVVSKSYQLHKRTGVKVETRSRVDPFDPDDTDLPATFREIVNAGKAATIEEAEEIWKDIPAVPQAPDLKKGRIIYTTLHRAQQWAEWNYFKVSHSRSYEQRQVVRNTVIVVDDVDEDAVSRFRPVSASREAKLRSAAEADGKEIKVVSGPFSSEKHTNRYLVRSDGRDPLAGLENRPVIFTTVEERVRMILEAQYGDDLAVHDGRRETAEARQSNLILVRTPLVQSKTHQLLRAVRDTVAEQGDEWTWIGDAVGLDENHFKVRGKNSFTDSDLVVKLSQPHVERTEKLLLDLALTKVRGMQNVATFLALLDSLTQAAGRNQGYRYKGRRCVVLCDPQYFQSLQRWTRFDHQAIDLAKVDGDFATGDSKVDRLLTMLMDPVLGPDNTLSGGLDRWVDERTFDDYIDAYVEAVDVYETKERKDRVAREKRFWDKIEDIKEFVRAGPKSRRQIEREFNLSRFFSPSEKAFYREHIEPSLAETVLCPA